MGKIKLLPTSEYIRCVGLFWLKVYDGIRNNLLEDWNDLS